MPSRSMVPPPEQGDTEDVARALTTAQGAESRGELQECVRWLRRAAEAAGEASKNERALLLAKAAAELTQRLEESTDVGQQVPRHLANPAAHIESELTPAAAVPARIGAPRKIAAAQSPGTHHKRDAPAPKEPMRAPSPSSTEEWDAMPTQALSSEELAHISRTDETPALSEAMRTAVRIDAVGLHQAVRVRVWADAAGVHVAPVTTHVPAPSVEAMLVGLDSTDLHAWLTATETPARR